MMKKVYNSSEECENMKCLNCGYEVEKEDNFCPVCGTPISKPVEAEYDTEPDALPKQAKCWSIFAKIGFGFGLAGLICCWIYTIGIELATAGIVFSALGRKSYEYHSKAKTGLILGIIGTALSFVFMVIEIVTKMLDLLITF